jgi:hypothetical protein
MEKIEDRLILRKSLIYSAKIWLVNLILLGILIYTQTKINFKYITIIVLIFFVKFIILGFCAYLIIKSKNHHVIKKITIVLIGILLIFIACYAFLGQVEDDKGSIISFGITFLLSIPILITSGLFYPDKLDEDIRNTN